MKFTVRFADYPAGDGWTLAYYLRGAGSLDVTGAMVVADGDAFAVTIPAASTATLAAGTYRYIARASLSSETYTADSGIVAVTPDVATATAGALQSHAERMVPLLETALERRVAADMVSYTLLNRSLTREELATYRALLAQYRLEVQAQRNGGRLPPYRTVFSRA